MDPAVPTLPTPAQGVQFRPPPPEYLREVTSKISEAVAQIPAGKSGALIGVVTQRGANAVLVAKVRGDWQTMAYVGKSWGQPVEVGAAILKTW